MQKGECYGKNPIKKRFYHWIDEINYFQDNGFTFSFSESIEGVHRIYFEKNDSLKMLVIHPSGEFLIFNVSN